MLILSRKQNGFYDLFFQYHDIGKKGHKSHSVYGKELTNKILKRLPVYKEIKELTLWLVENHLAMSDIAFKNDTQSPEAIAKFTSVANTEEKINSLFLFTLSLIHI